MDQNTFTKIFRNIKSRFSFSIEEIKEDCVFKMFGTNMVVIDEGQHIGESIKNVDLNQCKKHCEETTGCRSFALCNDPKTPKQCYPKNKVLYGNEATQWTTYYTTYECTTYYQSCGE